MKRLKRAWQATRWLYRKASRPVIANAPEVLTWAGAAALTVTAWVVHPVAGGVTLGASLLGIAWLVALGRRTG